jgi:hypothetical protein
MVETYFIERCAGITSTIALFLALEPAEMVADFLVFFEQKLDWEMAMVTDRALVIERFTDDVLIRMRAIERCARSRTLN